MKALTIGQRVEVLWHFWDYAEKQHVDRWLPGTVTGFASGILVKMDNGWTGAEYYGAHPDCVRPLMEVDDKWTK